LKYPFRNGRFTTFLSITAAWRSLKKNPEEDSMDNWTFGFTMLVVGMGGTLVALALLALIMELLKKIFPVREETEN
jgi:hypothetical protein